jgi:hypothetical protein
LFAKTIIVFKFVLYLYFSKIIVVKPNIWPDIRYPAFGSAGYSAKAVPVFGASLLLEGMLYVT